LAGWDPAPLLVERRDPRSFHRLRSEKPQCGFEEPGFDSPHLHADLFIKLSGLCSQNSLCGSTS
jgi:hypothetical protein